MPISPRQRLLAEPKKGGKSKTMKILTLAICSLGIWVVLNAFVMATWDDIVFGGITAVLAFIAMFTVK